MKPKLWIILLAVLLVTLAVASWAANGTRWLVTGGGRRPATA